MNPLFWRSLSEGLQAFVPVALYLAWADRNHNSQEIRGVRWGMVAAVPATIAAGFVFQSSPRQSLLEFGFAVAALLPAAWFARIAWSGRQSPSDVAGPNAAIPAAIALTSIVIIRQTMLIFAVLTAALALGSFEATSAICMGAASAVAIAVLVAPIARRLSREALLKAARACSLVFLAEVAIYAVHKAAESRLLPWSEPIETATEPYGPDGLYGLYISYLLILAPATAAGVTTVLNRRKRNPESATVGSAGRAAQVAAAIAALAVAAVAFGIVTGVWRTDSAPVVVTTERSAMPADVSSLSASPHLLFRHVALKSSERYPTATSNPASPYATTLSTRPDNGPDGVAGTADDTTISYYNRLSSTNLTLITNDPTSKQSYNGVEITATKRMSNRWQMLAGLTLAKTKIEDLSVNITPNSLLNVSGPVTSATGLGTSQTGDHPYIFKLTGSYILPFHDVMLAANLISMSGIAYTRQVTGIPLTAGGTAAVNVEPLGSHRLDARNQLDFRVSKNWHFGTKDLEGAFDVYNLDGAGGKIAWLVNTYASTIHASGTNQQAAGLQIAIWETLYDSNSLNTFNLSQGKFIVSASSVTIGWATTYLTSLYSSANNTSRTVWLDSPGNGNGQDQVTVPEPSTLALLLVAIGLILAFRRKSTASLTVA